MPQKILLVLLALFLNQNLLSQTYTFKKQIPQNEHADFLGLTKKIFEITKNISYNISSNDAEAKLENVKIKQYNEAYLKELQKKIAKDSLDPIVLNEFGNYYNGKGNKSLAKKYFNKSLNNWKLNSKTKKDSAFYYSFRGILKLNLEKENSIEDIEKAITINPKDSIAIHFYPLFLINNGEFIKAKEVCVSALEEKNTYPEVAYTFLGMADFFGQLNKIMDESKKTENVKKNYDELLDFQSINKYADLNKNNQKIQHLKKMFNLFGLMFKMYLFETTEDKNVIINYSKYDISKMNQLESDFQQLLIKKEINPFSGNKSLALLNFFLQKNDKAIEHSKKAITSFPESKRTHNFNSDEAYELLLTLYQLKNDDTNFKKTLEEKIIKSSEVQKSINDYLFMAYISLYKNDLEESEKWCNMAREIDMDNFNALSLFTHLKFMKNGFNNNSFGQFYLEQTQRQAKDDGDAYTFGIQSAAYMILRNNPEDAKFAFQNIEICKKLNSKDTGFCDKLIEKYIQATP